MRAQTEKTTFSCKDDCTLTNRTRRWTYSALRHFFCNKLLVLILASKPSSVKVKGIFNNPFGWLLKNKHVLSKTGLDLFYFIPVDIFFISKIQRNNKVAKGNKIN